jgi:hypothetical protein
MYLQDMFGLELCKGGFFSPGEGRGFADGFSLEEDSLSSDPSTPFLSDGSPRSDTCPFISDLRFVSNSIELDRSSASD